MATQPQENVDPDYADAFAAAAAAASGGDTPPAVEPPAFEPPAAEPPAVEPPVAPPAAEPPAVEPPAVEPPAVEPPAVEPPAAPPAAEPPASADDIVKGLADLLKAQPPVAPAAAAAEPAAPPYTVEEEAVLREYEKNWPDVAQAEALRRKVEYGDLLKFVFSEVVAHTKPLFEQMRTVGNTLHTGELKSLVPDYSVSLEADVTKWIETQPGYLQVGMKQVMEGGTSDEVADLIGRYRADAGVAPTAAALAAAPAAPAKPAKTELSDVAKKAAESLAPVSSDRSQAPSGEDPGDYVSAFAQYAAEMMPK